MKTEIILDDKVHETYDFPLILQKGDSVRINTHNYYCQVESVVLDIPENVIKIILKY